MQWMIEIRGIVPETDRYRRVYYQVIKDDLETTVVAGLELLLSDLLASQQFEPATRVGNVEILLCPSFPHSSSNSFSRPLQDESPPPMTQRSSTIAPTSGSSSPSTSTPEGRNGFSGK